MNAHRDTKIIIVQVPSEANAERLINTRLSDEAADGWQVAQMQDHNGFLILLMERAPTPPDPR